MTEDIYLYGGQDKDSMYEGIAEGDFLEAQNMRTLSKGESDKGRAVKTRGNVHVENPYSEIYVGNVVEIGTRPAFVGSKVLGHTRDGFNKNIYYFSKETFNVGLVANQYAIYEYDAASETISCVAKTSFRLFGEDYISAVVLDGVLYWASGIEMRAIDIQKGKNWFGLSYLDEDQTPRYNTITPDIVNLANKTMPILPRINYGNDPEVTTNNLRGKLYKFRFQYVYNDNSVSVLSPESQPLLPINELDDNGNFVESIRYNKIEISTPDDIPKEVKSIKIFVAYTLEAEGQWSEYAFIKEIFDFTQSPMFSYYGGISGRVISSRDDIKLYDTIMRNPTSCEVVSNPDRLIIADGLEGRDNIDIDVTVGQTAKEIETFGGALVSSHVAPYKVQIANVINEEYDIWIAGYRKRIVYDTYYHGAGICNTIDFNGIDFDNIPSTLTISLTFITSAGGTAANEEITIDTSTIDTAQELAEAVKEQVNDVAYGDNYAFDNKDEFLNFMSGGTIGRVLNDSNPDGIIGDSWFHLYDEATGGGINIYEAKRHWITSYGVVGSEPWIDTFLGSISDDNGVLYLRSGAILMDFVPLSMPNVKLRYKDRQGSVAQTYIDGLNDNMSSLFSRWQDSSTPDYDFSSNFLSGDYTSDDFDDIDVVSGTSGLVSTSTSGDLSDSIMSMMPYGEYGTGIVYYDEYLRPSFVQEADDLTIVPKDDDGNLMDTTFDHVSYRPQIEIKHEAPSWAKYWSFVITENKKFIPILYLPTAHVNEAGDYVAPWSTINDTSDGLKIDINDAIDSWNRSYDFNFSSENSSGDSLPNYIWQKGDRAVIYKSGGVGYIDCEIIKQDDFDTDNGSIYLNYYETDYGIADEVLIYRPRKETIDYVYYEVGGFGTVRDGEHYYKDGINIQDEPTEIEYGDSYVTTTNYLLNKNGYYYGYTEDEPADPDDYLDTNVFNPFFSFFYQSSSDWLGRTHVVKKDATEKSYSGRIRWSNAYVSNADDNADNEINGIRTFHFEDKMDLSSKYGGITEMYEIGYTLKILMRGKILSVYIGTVSTKNIAGTEDLIITDSPLGTVRIPAYDYGCQHPKSAIKHNRYVYFVDAANGVVCRDAANGQQVVSNLKMSSVWDNILTDAVEEDYDIIGSYDKNNKEYGVTVFNGDGNTLIFNEEDNRWKGHRTYGEPDGFEYAGRCFVGWKNGELYVFGEGNFGEYFGETSESYIKFPVNDAPNFVKTMKAIAIHADGSWNAGEDGDVYCYPKGMSGRIKAGKFTNKEGTYYTEMPRDGNTPNGESYGNNIVNGRDLKYRTADITLRDSENVDKSIFSVSIKYLKSNNTY